MATQPPAASTPIHPRLLELAAQAVDSPSSTPGSAVTTSSLDKTGDTEKSQQSTIDDESSRHDSSGESLGIRARRPGSSSGFIDPGESPQGTSSSQSSNTADMNSKSTGTHTTNPHSSPDASPSQSAHSNSDPHQVAQADSLHRPDQPQEDSHHHQDHLDDKAGNSAAASPSSNRITDLVKEAHLVSGFKGRAANFYSPPPPSQGASLNRGDYYSESATTNIPSPRLEAIIETSSEISGRYRAAMMDKTPLRQAPGFSQTALAKRRQTPYAGSLLLQDIMDSSKSLTDSSGKLSTPSNKSGASFNDSIFESPLLAPMAPYGSPIRFSSAGDMLIHTIHAQSRSMDKSPVSVPLNKRLTIRRPPSLDALSPLKREEAKIRDMLWKAPAPAPDEEDGADADILPPEVEQLGPPSPYVGHFDKSLAASPGLKTTSEDQATHSKGSIPASSKPRALIRMHSQPGPNGNLNKIPTLVGPNSLPYARCPSGVDSFAFDLHHPRPYDIVMPVMKESALPRSVSCDDKLLYRGVDSSLTEEGEAATSNTAEVNKPKATELPNPVNYTIHRAASATTSTHHERARQRMERVKMATMKREQARLEEQNRKEVARITRNLVAEQVQREEALRFEHAAFGHQNRQLNSGAVPFTLRSPQTNSATHVAMPYGFPTSQVLSSVHDNRQEYTQVRGQASTFSNIAEASHSQNRLLHILQQRMQGMQLTQEAQVGLQQAFSYGTRPSAQMQALPTVHGSGVLSAINTMMQTNQQLIAMLQKTEKMLASNGPPGRPLHYAPPGLEHMVPQAYRAQNTYVTTGYGVSEQYRFLDPTTNSEFHQHEVTPEPPFNPNTSASRDPAVVRSHRRKSVTFEEADADLPHLRANVSTSDIPRSPNKPLPALARSVHEVPPRPFGIKVSQKLLGILPLDSVPASQEKAAFGVTTLSGPAPLRESTSTLTPSEGENRRTNRSNAPSPECFSSFKPAQIRGVTSRPLAAKAPHKNTHNGQRNFEPSRPRRQPMTYKPANISVSSIYSGKGSGERRQSSGKANKTNDVGNKAEPLKIGRFSQSARGESRKGGRLDDQTWTSFVRQMGGVTQSPATA